MLAVLLFGLVSHGLSGQAPLKAPPLPVGWCSENEGTLTATTGECMCRYQCDGPKCQSGQGMIWYAYKDCPQGCRCAPHEPPKKNTDAPFNTENALCSEQKTGCGELKQSGIQNPISTKTDKPYDHQEGNYPSLEDYDSDDYYGFETLENVQEEETEHLSTKVIDWLDENYRLIFGGFVILLLSCTILPTLFYAVGSTPEVSKSGKPPATT